MKAKLQQLIKNSLDKISQHESLDLNIPEIKIERCRDKNHGDYASNIAMILAKQAKTSPRKLAEKIIINVESNSLIAKTNIAGPGFINFSLNHNVQFEIIKSILTDKKNFGHNKLGEGKKLQLEFVSANPTGPLHVGHGRGAAYGATLANLLSISGYDISKEYYVNDAGRQMDILATSLWLRYQQSQGIDLPFPANAYQGDYIKDILKEINAEYKPGVYDKQTILNDLPADESEGGDKEIYIDALIHRAKSLSTEEYQYFFDLAINSILGDIKEDLAEFGVTYDVWYSEQSLMSAKKVNACINELNKTKVTYKKDNALWFKSTDFGDDKDRVIQRENGQTTYFASDIAYHQDKFQRNFDELINIWGADHHGYITRVKSALKALSYDDNSLQILLVQFANLYRHGEKVQMSTRSGSFVTLRELREEVGNDAARFFYVMRKCEQHLDFDLDIAKSKTSENPVYYIQYAHARICSVFRQLEEKQLKWDKNQAYEHLNLLKEEHEINLLGTLTSYPDMIRNAALKREPHLIAHYLRELANQMHAYYNKHQFIVENVQLRSARLALISAVKQILANGLTLLGVSAPESM